MCFLIAWVHTTLARVTVEAKALACSPAPASVETRAALHMVSCCGVSSVLDLVVGVVCADTRSKSDWTCTRLYRNTLSLTYSAEDLVA